MSIEPSVATFQLARDAMRTINAQPGQSIACVRGMLWLTQADDERDIVLAAGDTFVLDRRGIALVTALNVGAVFTYQWQARPRAPSQPDRTEAQSTVGAFVDALDTFRPSYDPDKLKDLSIGVCNALVEQEARRMRSVAAEFILRYAVGRMAKICADLKRRAVDIFATVMVKSKTVAAHKLSHR